MFEYVFYVRHVSRLPGKYKEHHGNERCISYVAMIDSSFSGSVAFRGASWFPLIGIPDGLQDFQSSTRLDEPDKIPNERSIDWTRMFMLIINFNVYTNGIL